MSIDDKKIGEKHKVRDWWDKLDIISKFVTAGIVTLITIVGSSYLNDQQDRTRNNQLLSQFMSDQEKAENQVRKDMFEKILVEFWESPKDGSCVLDTIDQHILQLGLLSRNFHETLDLSPLFQNVLMKIVRNINAENFELSAEQLKLLVGGEPKIIFDDECTKRAYRRLFSRNNSLLNEEMEDFNKPENKELYDKWKVGFKDDYIKNKNKNKNKNNNNNNNHCDLNADNKKYCMYRFIFSQHINKMKNRKKEELIKISRRIAAKQMESLSDVVVRLRLKVDLKKTCVDTKPTDEFNDDRECDVFGDKTKVPGILEEQYVNGGDVSDIKRLPSESYSACEITYLGKVVDENGKKIAIHRPGIMLHLGDKKDNKNIKNKTSRCYSLSVKRAYPKWNQVYVEVMTNRTDEELNADQFGGLANKASFWLGFFDFPMADNTYLSNKERFAVVLDKLDADSNEAELSLVYFPAAYAGIKEKAFYQQRLLKYLNDKDG